jgi:hypothetical protein
MALNFKLGYPSTATKVGGGGYVPGYGKVGSTKSIGSGFGGKLTNSLSTSLAANVVPTFTAQVPTVAPQTQAKAGEAPQLSNGQSGSGAAVAAHNDPRDPTYWTDVAKIQNTFSQNEAQYNLQQQQGQTQLTNTIAQLDRQNPIDIGNARGNYNNAGLFYSSRLGGTEGDINYQYGQAKNTANTGYGNLVDQLNILRNSNQAQYGRGPNGELTGTAYLDALNAGIGRASAADAEYAQQNLLAQILAAQNAPPPPAPAPAAPVSNIPPGFSAPIGSIWANLSGIGRRSKR